MVLKFNDFECIILFGFNPTVNISWLSVNSRLMPILERAMTMRGREDWIIVRDPTLKILTDALI